MKFYDEYKDRRGEFEIVAFHDPSAKDLEDLEAKIAGVRQQVWEGQDLPFPVVMDNTGETVRAYGIDSFPTVLLLDPEGNIVRGGGEPLLASKLKETSPAVRALVEKLALAKKLAAALDEVVAAGGDDAAFALATYARASMKPTDALVVFRALAKLENDIALGALLGDYALRAKDPAVRAAAAKALGESGDKRALPELQRVAKEDGVERVKKAAADAAAFLQK